MPVLTSPEISIKFKEQRPSLDPDGAGVAGLGDFDDSLTSLQWLQDFSILTANLEKHPGSDGHSQRLPLPVAPPDTNPPSSPPTGDTAGSGVPQSLRNMIPSSASANTGRGRDGYSYPLAHPHGHATRPPQEVDYRTNHQVKPPYSYATLICMAMRASRKNKLTLSAIYGWITENFCYYRRAEPSWQNSIRHNLSLNKCFVKVPRTKEEPGKGGFWQIDPQYADMFVDGIFKRRRASSVPHVLVMKGHHGKARPPHVLKQRHSSRERGLGAPPGTGSLLTPEPTVGMASGGAMDWTPGLEDVAIDGHAGSNFEDLDVNIALSSLGCELDGSLQGCPLVSGGKWCSDVSGIGVGGVELACGFAEAESDLLQAQQGGAQPHPPPRPLQYEELVSPFSQLQTHPWVETREGFNPTPLACVAEPTLSCYEGFLSDTVCWGGMEPYL
ncbi:hypothetical protein AGOR_G00221000 [Albula goreensis]|uniref:Fork-head domain-containing protein n=1 Tax=Albula goreensis TaxID=1534307 RepID=A0A8T3CMB5_9TELE|nr:hypothetical protein AGOR_G00221000 [Albula goreensis]